MNEFYSRDYNETVSLRMNDTWILRSRNNIYRFNTSYGIISIEEFVDKLKVSSILDYGCGFGHALDKVSLRILKYDPFVSEFKDHPTEKSELTVCFNVLNCIEPEHFDAVIKDLHALTEKFLIVNIKTPGLYDNDKDWYRFKFETEYSNLFKIFDMKYSETITEFTRKEKTSSTIIEHECIHHNDLFLLLKII